MNNQAQEALKMAIEALEQAHSLAFKEIAGSPPDEVLFEDALIACKEALEQPAQEPVAYEIVTVKLLKDEYGFTYDGWNNIIDSPMKSGTKLYTHPAPAKEPLSDDEIFSIAFSLLIGNPADFDIDPIRFTRAIEQAHGIGS